jgi:hypothetical protein
MLCLENYMGVLLSVFAYALVSIFCYESLCESLTC